MRSSWLVSGVSGAERTITCESVPYGAPRERLPILKDWCSQASRFGSVSGFCFSVSAVDALAVVPR